MLAMGKRKQSSPGEVSHGGSDRLSMRVPPPVNEFINEIPSRLRKPAIVFLAALLRDPDLPYVAREFILSEGRKAHDRKEHGQDVITTGLAKGLARALQGVSGDERA